jgi:hypothetical protein
MRIAVIIIFMVASKSFFLTSSRRRIITIKGGSFCGPSIHLIDKEAIMKKPFILQKLSIACFLAATLLMACITTEPSHVYQGAKLGADQLTQIKYPGTGFYRIILYSVDGLPNLQELDGFVPASFTDMGNCGFNVLVPPGTHRLEFYTVHSSPFDNAPLSFLSLTFKTEIGKSYIVAEDKGAWVVTENGNKVGVEQGVVPVLEEPAANAPHINLVIKHDGSSYPWIFRVDGKLRKVMTAYEPQPRWLVFNTVDGSPFNQNNGTLDLRLEPGTHVIEYGTNVVDFFFRKVRRITVTADAGKTVVLSLYPDKKAPETDARAEIE